MPNVGETWTRGVGDRTRALDHRVTAQPRSSPTRGVTEFPGEKSKIANEPRVVRFVVSSRAQLGWQCLRGRQARDCEPLEATALRRSAPGRGSRTLLDSECEPTPPGPIANQLNAERYTSAIFPRPHTPHTRPTPPLASLSAGPTSRRRTALQLSRKRPECLGRCSCALPELLQMEGYSRCLWQMLPTRGLSSEATSQGVVEPVKAPRAEAQRGFTVIKRSNYPHSNWKW